MLVVMPEGGLAESAPLLMGQTSQMPDLPTGPVPMPLILLSAEPLPMLLILLPTEPLPMPLILLPEEPLPPAQVPPGPDSPEPALLAKAPG